MMDRYDIGRIMGTEVPIEAPDPYAFVACFVRGIAGSTPTGLAPREWVYRLQALDGEDDLALELFDAVIAEEMGLDDLGAAIDEAGLYACAECDYVEAGLRPDPKDICSVCKREAEEAAEADETKHQLSHAVGA